MKHEKINLDKNISRLVKLTAHCDKPSEHFIDSLTAGALDQLQNPQAAPPQDRKAAKMNFHWKKTLSLAAAIMIFCGLGTAILLPHLAKDKPLVSLSGNDSIEFIGGTIAKLENTTVVSATQPTSAPEHESKLHNKLVAKAMDRLEPLRTSSRTTDSARIVNGAVPQSNISLGAGTASDSGRIAGRRRGGAIYRGDIKRSTFNYDSSSNLYYTKAKQLPSNQNNVLNENLKGVLSYNISSADGAYAKPVPPGMANGGTATVNDEAADAMFFKNYGVNPFVDTEDDHLSTFATDVDTGSYTIARRYLSDGHLPPNDSVRVEEFVNYFKYDYPAPQKETFALYTEAAPWQFDTTRQNNYLLRIGLKGKQVNKENRKPAVLTFVIDVSGSMSREDRLGLVKQSLHILIDNLDERDFIGIAVYGSHGKKILDHTNIADKQRIIAAIDSLQSEGSTNAEEGIKIGYEMAEKAYRQGYINRVILCSDGVANVGNTGPDSIMQVIKSKVEKGITLSSIGFGMGNMNDVLLERLGDMGDGHYAYVDTINEAQRIFSDNLTGTLQVIARDVKIQVDFNPKVVRSYRLIGYENRDVPDQKFHDDKYDGGEMGAGHAATALYELKLWPGKKGTVATTYIRYKHPETRKVTEFNSQFAVRDFKQSFENISPDYRLAAAAAEFAEILRKSYWAKQADLKTVLHCVQQVSDEYKNNPDIIELVDMISKTTHLLNPCPAENEVENQTEDRSNIDIAFIEKKINDFDDVDSFVVWLTSRSGVTEVTQEKKKFLTSNPPQQQVTFRLDGVEYNILIPVDIENKIKILKPTIKIDQKR